MGPGSPPNRLATEDRWLIETLVMVYGSEEVRWLLKLWTGEAKKTENTDYAIERPEQTSNPAQYGSRHSLAGQGDFGGAGESGAFVVPAGAGLMASAEF